VPAEDRTCDWGWRRQGIYTEFWEEFVLKTLILKVEKELKR